MSGKAYSDAEPAAESSGRPKTRNRVGAQVWRGRLNAGAGASQTMALDAHCGIAKGEYRLGLILGKVTPRPSLQPQALPVHFCQSRTPSFDDMRAAILLEGTATGGFLSRALCKWFYKRHKFDD
jgi:hypothetical protein